MAKTVQIGAPRGISVPDSGTSLIMSSASHGSVFGSVQSAGAKTTALPSTSRLRAGGPAQLAFTARDVGREEGSATGALDQLHGGRPARIHLDHDRLAAPGNEVDAVDSPETEGAGEGLCRGDGTGDDFILGVEHRCPGAAEQVAAPAVTGGAEADISDQLPRHAERHGVVSIGDEHERCRDALHPLLQQLTVPERVGRAPPAYAAAAATPPWLGHEFAAGGVHHGVARGGVHRG